MLTAKNGKVAGTFISPLYDLQTEPKENASGPSRAYPGHRLHIDSIDDKKTVVKANKNAPTDIPGGPGQNFRQEIYAGQILILFPQSSFGWRAGQHFRQGKSAYSFPNNLLFAALANILGRANPCTFPPYFPRKRGFLFPGSIKLLSNKKRNPTAAHLSTLPQGSGTNKINIPLVTLAL